MYGFDKPAQRAFFKMFKGTKRHSANFGDSVFFRDKSVLETDCGQNARCPFPLGPGSNGFINLSVLFPLGIRKAVQLTAHCFERMEAVRNC